jgi:hypothetical protein
LISNRPLLRFLISSAKAVMPWPSGEVWRPT